MVDRPLTEEERKLVEENIPLAKFLYNIYRKKLEKRADYGIDEAELLSQAYHGLIRGARRYRAYGEERGYSEESIVTGQYFSAFVRKSIIGQMLDYLRQIDHVHSSVRRDYKILQENGLGASDKKLEDIVESSGLTMDRMKQVVSKVQAKPTSLQLPVSSETDMTVADIIPSEGDTVESTARETFLRKILYDEYMKLSDLSKVVIAMKYVEHEKLPDIANKLEVPITDIREIHTEALIRFHEAWVQNI